MDTNKNKLLNNEPWMKINRQDENQYGKQISLVEISQNVTSIYDYMRLVVVCD
jgi:hypothetical protein